MRLTANIRRWKLYVGTLYVLALLIGGVFIASQDASAAGGVGSGGTPGTGSGSGYYSDNGFGWRLYDVTSRTPPSQVGAMTDGSWDTVYNACHDIGQVWMFMIFNPSGVGKEYALHYYVKSADDNSIGFFETRLVSGVRRIYYNDHVSNGVYYANHYVGNASENTVHGYFNKAVSEGIIDPGGLSYGNSVGWFCYQDIRYNLKPSLTSDHVGGEAGEPVNVTPRIDNNDTGATASRTTYWTISSMTYASGSTPPSSIGTGGNGGVAAVDTAKPCQYYTGTGAANCQFLSGSSGTGKFSKGAPSTFTYTTGVTWGTQRFILGNYSVGTKVCYGLSVYSRNQQTGTSQTWAHSAPVCTIISRKPKIQVHGGDIIVGRSFIDGGTVLSADVNTSQTVKYR